MKRIIHTILIGTSLSVSPLLYAFDDLLAMGLSEFNLPEFNEYDVPVVLTATRLQQHQADVPASVTILDERFIKQVGAQNLTELLRYVPGMMIGPDNNNNADAVHYHGGPAALPKNLQVLVNGRSMYRSGLAAVSWYEIPVALEDIKRIEVVRGPNAASYGANAFQAIVNILTKHPADTYGASVSVQGGNNGEENIYAKQGGRLGHSDYRVSFTQKQTDGFAYDNDSRQARFIDFEHYYQNASLGEFESSVVVLDAKKYISDTLEFQINDNIVTEQRFEVGSRWTKDLSSKHQLQINGYVTQYQQRQKVNVAGVPVAALDDNLRALYQLNPQAANAIADGIDPSPYIDMTDTTEINLVAQINATYLPGGSTNPLSVVSGDINADLDEYRYDIEVQDTYIYSPSLTFVSGASFRRDEVQSHTFFNGHLSNDTSRLFASATWQATTNTNLHLGVMAEQESDADLVFAPRAAMNYKLTPSQSLRLVYSEAVRSPDLFEQDACWQLTLDNPTPTTDLNGTTYYQTQQGPGDLDHQYIRSYELGYYGRLDFLNSELDVRLFEEDLTDVFYQSLRIQDFETTRDINMTFQGVEWQYAFAPWHAGQLRWVGAYVNASTNLDSDPQSTLLKVYARNTHTISWLQTWGESTTSSVSYILANKYDDKNATEAERTKLERIDMKVTHSVVLPSISVDLTANVQHDLSSDPYIWGNNVYQAETRYQLAARINF